MDARLSPDRDYANEPSEVATAYRVTLWEQPARPPDIDRPRIGWSPYPGVRRGGVRDVRSRWCSGCREAIEWADATLATNEGPASRRGCPVDRQEYVIYAKVPNEESPAAGRGPAPGA